MELFLSRMLTGLVIPFQVAPNTELSAGKVRGEKMSPNHREVFKSLDENPVHPNVI